jgi:hypothetical protein
MFTRCMNYSTHVSSHVFKMSKPVRQVNDADAVFFIHVETTVLFAGQSAEAIEISIIDGNSNVIIDTIIDYGLTDLILNIYATLPNNDFRY